MFKQVAIGAIALYLTDMFIAPYFAGGPLMYFLKFLLQAWIMIYIVNKTDYHPSPMTLSSTTY